MQQYACPCAVRVTHSTQKSPCGAEPVDSEREFRRKVVLVPDPVHCEDCEWELPSSEAEEASDKAAEVF